MPRPPASSASLRNRAMPDVRSFMHSVRALSIYRHHSSALRCRQVFAPLPQQIRSRLPQAASRYHASIRASRLQISNVKRRPSAPRFHMSSLPMAFFFLYCFVILSQSGPSLHGDLADVPDVEGSNFGARGDRISEIDQSTNTYGPLEFDDLVLCLTGMSKGTVTTNYRTCRLLLFRQSRNTNSWSRGLCLSD